MKVFLAIFLGILLFGCSSQKNNVELEIITKEINYLDIDSTKYVNYLKLDTVINKSKTVLLYKITNNTDKTYYFNIDSYNNNLKYDYIMVDKAFLSIYNSEGEYQKPNVSIPTQGVDKTDIYMDYLNYVDYLSYHRGLGRNKNFILHPHETLYFEWFIVLPFGNLSEDINYTISLNPHEKYFAEILIHSDTTNYKKILSRTDLKTIKENGYEIYNGTVKSINKVPIIGSNVSN